MNDPVHLNAAGAALPLLAAQDAVIAHMREEARFGPHRAAAAADGRLARARGAAAALLGADTPADVAFGETATRLWASALGALPLRAGDRILMARCEWGGNVLNALKRVHESDAKLEIVRSDGAGLIDVHALAGMIDERVVAICVPGVSSGLGIVQPVGAIGSLPRPDDCLLFVDAAQVAGRAPAGLRLWQADVVTAPGRKWLRGPRGQAVMALSRRALSVLGDPPLLDQAGSRWAAAGAWATKEDATKFESYEFSVAGRLGFGQALERAVADLEAIRRRDAALLGVLRAGLGALPEVTVFEDAGSQAAFLTFERRGEVPSETVARLAKVGIAVATVGLGYARLELESRGLTEVCRVSPHSYNSQADLARLLDAL